MNDGKLQMGQAIGNRLGAGRRRVIVYGPTMRSRVVRAYHRAMRSWNWTVAVAAAFMIALVVTTVVSGQPAPRTASSALTSHDARAALRLADYSYTGSSLEAQHSAARRHRTTR
jgi:hypothetical protein